MIFAIILFALALAIIVIATAIDRNKIENELAEIRKSIGKPELPVSTTNLSLEYVPEKPIDLRSETFKRHAEERKKMADEANRRNLTALPSRQNEIEKKAKRANIKVWIDNEKGPE